jgi:hypothetical protein
VEVDYLLETRKEYKEVTFGYEITVSWREW